MSNEPERTTKYVTGTFTLTFHGNHIDAGDIPGYFEGWVDAGLDDRDDLRSWSFNITETRVVEGDPEGYDR